MASPRDVMMVAGALPSLWRDSNPRLEWSAQSTTEFAREVARIEVIDQLPVSNRNRVLRLAARTGTQGPSSPQLALSVAAAHLRALRVEGDQRSAGRARSVLNSDLVKGHAQARLMSADLMQHQHEFTSARQVLDLLVRDRPDMRPAWLLLANTARVQGDLLAALSACRSAHQLRADAWSRICQADVRLMLGHSNVFQQLHSQIASDRAWQRDASLAVWMADIADRSDRPDSAMQYFRRAMLLGSNHYGVQRFARFLLDQNEAQKARALLSWWRDQYKDVPDVFLLREALAASAMGDTQTSNERASVFARRANANALSVRPRHWRELAEFEWRFGDDVVRANRHAIKNWSQQKEPIDALLLARTAIAARDSGTLISLDTFLSQRMPGMAKNLREKGLLNIEGRPETIDESLK